LRSEPFEFVASDGARIHVERWLPEAEPRAWVQVIHGMGEHAGRYARFAESVCAAGLAVAAHDQRGHGRTALQGKLGDTGPGGFRAAIRDVAELGRALLAASPHPRVLFGHSMGSFIARAALLEADASVAGCALSAPALAPRARLRCAARLARAEECRLGPAARSPLLHRLVFGRAERAFQPSRTHFDWLSRDPAEVDAYVSDPHCGFVLGARSLREMFAFLIELDGRAAAPVPRGRAIYLFAGADDPLGGARAIAALAGRYHRAGVESVATRVYPGARHETLNELNRKEVEADLLHWISSCIERAGG
jgi:alpha-beta hydrolase superfamily lysophospholipase